jgi:hypothetical protein
MKEGGQGGRKEGRKDGRKGEEGRKADRKDGRKEGRKGKRKEGRTFTSTPLTNSSPRLGCIMRLNRKGREGKKEK